jgi:L-amino acid N-acyltransferase YncA
MHMSRIEELGEYRLREASLDDLETLVYHRRVMFVEATGVEDEKALNAMDEAYKKHILKAMPAGNLKAWLVESKDGKVVSGGALSVYEAPPRPQDDTLNYVYIHSVYTEPEHRRKGLARAILNTIVQSCKDNGFKTLTLHAVEASRSLYESLGFTHTTEMRVFV